MAKNNSDPAVEAESVEDTKPADPGFQVHQGKTFCGTFETEEDAQAFIDGQLTPQKLDAKIVAVE